MFRGWIIVMSGDLLSDSPAYCFGSAAITCAAAPAVKINVRKRNRQLRFIVPAVAHAVRGLWR